MTTRYEMVLEHPQYGRYLHCYSARKSRHGIITAMRNHEKEVTDFTGAATWYATSVAIDGIETQNGWTLRLSGRTQLDAKAEGELSWYRDYLGENAPHRVSCTA